MLILTPPLKGVPDITLQRAETSRNQRLELGRVLFFDKRLSEDRTVSCATCHDPASAFASGDAIAIGVREHKGTRNAPTLLNSVFSKSYFWDGRASTLEEQAKQPLLNANEMGMKSEAALVERVSAIAEYRESFGRVFPREGITIDTIAKAIAAFERSLVSRNSPFDRFTAGDKKALTEHKSKGGSCSRERQNVSIVIRTLRPRHSSLTPNFTIQGCELKL